MENNKNIDNDLDLTPLIALLVIIFTVGAVVIISFYPIQKLNNGDFGITCRDLCINNGGLLGQENPRYCWCDFGSYNETASNEQIMRVPNRIMYERPIGTINDGLN